MQRGAISVQELRLCLNESSENISVYGADCKTIIKGEGQLTVEQATQVYDLFEAVVETELESLRALLISIEVGKWVEVALCVSAAEPLCGLRARFPDLEWEQDEDGLLEGVDKEFHCASDYTISPEPAATERRAPDPAGWPRGVAHRQERGQVDVEAVRPGRQ